ncbi:hypothetical protein M1512_04700 [Patescibacteria group bacterium]|nr:hypothetical protein [Patescibacteria group bacterium]
MTPKRLSLNAVKALLMHPPQSPAVTIYLPTHRRASPPKISADEVRLKNLKNEAVKIIRTLDEGKKFADEFNSQLDRLIESLTFWEHQDKGLLICVRPNLFQLFYLPLDTEEYLAVDKMFHLAPVLGLLGDLQNYYVLAISQHEPALFSGDYYCLRRLNVGLPQSLRQALQIDEPGRISEQQHSARGNNGYNGRGGDKDIAQEERLRFWRLIDRKCLKYIKRERPLLLAGIESEVAEYLEQTSYPFVIKKHIEGSWGNSNLNELFSQAIAMIKQEVVAPKHTSVITEFKKLRGNMSELTAHNLIDIMTAAEQGRIAKLLLAGIRVTTDTVREDRRPAEVISFPNQEMAEIVNRVALDVWNSRGKIVLLKSNQMPVKGAVMLAVLRY